MELVLLVARIGLSLVFVLAGAGKLASRLSQNSLLETFELAPWARPAVRALPFAELAVGTGLLFPATARPSAIAATGMLAVFSALLVRQAARGRETSCNCFGSLGASVTGWHPLARNLALLVASLVITGARTEPNLSGPGVGPIGGSELMVLVPCGVVAAIAAWSRWRGRTGPADEGHVRELVAGRRRTLVVFLEPGCAPCRSLLPALARFGSTEPGKPLVVVTKEGSEVDAEFAAATGTAWRHVRDRGQLAGRLGVPATPAAAVLMPDGSVEELVVGAPGVGQLLGGNAAGSTKPAPELKAPITLSRRRLVAAGFASAVLLPGLGRSLSLRNLRRGLAAQSGVTCPSCGTCVICSASSASPKKLSCGPCSQRCSGHKLCASYANEYGPFTALAGYLRSRGFVQDGDPLTYGLERDGQLTVLSGVTTFAGGPSAAPRAVLIYELTNGGQNAWAALTNDKGLVGSVTTVVGGQVVSAAVSPPAPSATVSSSTHATNMRSEVEAAATSPYSCADVCAFAVGVATSMLLIPVSLVAAPETAALAFAGSLFAGGVGLASGPNGDALSLLLPLVQG
ncbi:MAG TPA: MauE/DoxX family redox-associated membrane protein, partial [Acidimicrobiales bacterium]|nr:MauE/DoxX family redox-associated membrane protein [Acidimicrobiales bacterium]